MKLRTRLATHQLEDVKFLRRLPRSANFNDCGLGKTLEELVLIGETWDRDSRNKAIVFCPKSCLVSWEDEILKHTDLVRGDYWIVTGTKEKKTEILNRHAQLFITNYETALTNYRDILNERFHHIVCDESTRIKNSRAKVSMAITTLADRAKVVRIMSGLPTPQSPTEIFSQFRAMDGGETFGPSYNHFLNRWFDKYGRWPAIRWALKSGLKSDFLELIHRKSVRRLRSSVIDLPPITTTRRVVEWEYGRSRRAYLDLEKATCAEVLADNINNPLTKMEKLTQFTSGFIYGRNSETKTLFKDNPKLEELERCLYDYNVQDNKVIISGIHLPELELVRNLCDKMGLYPRLIHGGVSEEERAGAIRAFESDPACRVLVGNQKVMAHGLNLQHANIVIFYNLSFSVDQYKQLCDRIQRRGQEKNCLIVHLIIRGTIDELRYDIVGKNLKVAEALMQYAGGVVNEM